MTARDVEVLFDPASVTIVGASADASKWGHALARQALRSDRRPVHLVNRRGGRMLGQRVARSVEEIGDRLSLVVICVPVDAFEAAVDDALEAGARGIVGITAGFAETGADGRRAQARIAAKVAAESAILVGPNSLGLVDNTSEVYLSSDTFRDGGVAFLSQSGNLALELDLRLAPHGLGISRFVSFGNQADVTLVDLLASCAAHDATKVIAVYAEDFGDGRAFIQAAGRAGKPVVLLSAGGSSAADRSAASHTGSLTSPADVVAAACRDAGVHQVATPNELTAVVASLAAGRRSAGRRTAVLTDGGGHGAVAAVGAERAGLAVPELDAELQSALRNRLWGPSAVGNPIDLAGMGERDPMSYAASVETLCESDDVDAVLMTGFFGGYAAARDGLGGALGAGERDAARAIAALRTDTPIVVQSMYPQSPSCRFLREAGIPVFGNVEDAARSLAAVTGVRDPAGVEPLPAAATPIDETGYFATRTLLGDAGVPFPVSVEVRSADQARAVADALPGPFVLKAVGLLHKTDAGGVALGLADAEAVAAAFDRMHGRLGDMAYAVEQMVDGHGSVELIVGVKRDPRFGPVAMVGFGGIYAEVLADLAFALAPVSEVRAAALLRSLRASPILDGVRGRRPVDIAAAARAVAAVTCVAAAHPELTEIEVNPLLVRPDGALALDARAIALTPGARSTPAAPPSTPDEHPEHPDELER